MHYELFQYFLMIEIALLLRLFAGFIAFLWKSVIVGAKNSASFTQISDYELPKFMEIAHNSLSPSTILVAQTSKFNDW